VRESVTGTFIGQESGKAFFGNWLTLAGGESKTVKLSYKLPFKLGPTDHHSLLIQKQPGSQPSHVAYNFHFPQYEIAWKNFDAAALETSSLTSDFQLTQDQLLGMVLVKR
jgi:hypothetical protein